MKNMAIGGYMTSTPGLEYNQFLTIRQNLEKSSSFLHLAKIMRQKSADIFSSRALQIASYIAEITLLLLFCI